MIDPDDYIFLNIDVALINPDYIHEGPSRDQLDFVIKPAFEPSGGNTHRVYQQVPKIKQTPLTHPIPCGWAKISPRPPQFANAKTTDTY